MLTLLFLAALLQTTDAAPQHATLTLYREVRQAAKWRKPTVMLDEREAAVVRNGYIIDLDVSTGRHTVRTEDLPGFSFVAITGAHYYARLDQIASFNVNWRITMIDPQEGAPEVEELRSTKPPSVTK